MLTVVCLNTNLLQVPQKTKQKTTLNQDKLIQIMPNIQDTIQDTACIVVLGEFIVVIRSPWMMRSSWDVLNVSWVL